MQALTRRSLIAATIAAGGLATLRGNELDDLFAPPPDGQAQPVTYRQGTVIAWDRNTLANVINVGGSLFTDLPVMGVAESQTLTAGSVVGIHCVGGTSETWSIIGRSVIPGTAEAAEAVSLLNGLIYPASVAATEATGSTTYADLTTIGPRVTVPVGPSGRLLVIGTADVSWADVAGVAILAGGIFGIALSGANTATAFALEGDFFGAAYRDTSVTGGAQLDGNVEQAVTAACVLSGLNVGDTTVLMRYRCFINPPNVSFGHRTLTVVRL